MSVRLHLRRSVQTLLAACLVGLLLSPAAEGAATSTDVPSASVQRALRFWTPARMRHARPLDASRSVEGGLAHGSRASSEDSLPFGRDPAVRARAEFVEVADSTAPGYRQNGVIFFVVPGFGAGRCSGTSVNAPNRSVVITAGHCVNVGDRRHWFNRDWIFVPGYHDGVRPFGVFAAKWLGATAGWVNGGSENSDVGAAVVSRNEHRQRLGDAVGGYGVAFGLSPNQVFDVHGYPAEWPFDGTSQRICSATPYLGHDIASFLWSGPLNLGLLCETTGGASGGGWTIHGNVLNSVTNYGYDDDRRTNFGSYFGATVKALYRRAAAMR